MKLFELAAKNVGLRYLDENTGNIFRFQDLNFVEFNDLKSLAFLYLDNSIKSISLYWSFMASDHAICLLDPKLNEELKGNLERAYTPKYIYDLSREEISDYRIEDDLFVNYRPCNYNISSKLKLLLTTSGTTGSPKLVKLSEENLIKNAKSIVNYLPINPEDVSPLNLPIFYSYGLSVLNSNSISGGTISCTNLTILDKSFWKNLQHYEYTSIAGVPYIYEVLNRIGFLEKNYPSLRYLTQAGGKLNTKLVEKFANFCSRQNIDFYVMYGQTEATARISYLDPSEINRKAGSIGKAILNGSLSLDSETNELLYQGPNIFGGYAHQIEDLAHYDKINELKTGDVAEVDEDGFYFITGRLKRFVKLFGRRINLDEIESQLKNEFGGGRLFAVVGKNDKRLSINYEGGALEQKEISEFLNNLIGLHPSTIRVARLDEMPLKSNGKLDYSAL